MWGTGRTPAGLHVHTTVLCWTARAARSSEKRVLKGSWLVKPTHPI